LLIVRQHKAEAAVSIMQQHKTFILTLKMEALRTSVMSFPLPYNSMSQPKTQKPIDIHRCEQLPNLEWIHLDQHSDHWWAFANVVKVSDLPTS
jgi:hypothetical protein